MSDLQDKINLALVEKATKIIPENIKKDVTILGVTGTYEGSGGGTVEGVKQFSTIEEMQADTTAKEGDLAVVYREEIQPVTEESEFDSCTFPNTVVLDSAFSGNINGSFRSTGSSYFDGSANMSSSRFRFTGYGESGQIRVQYESQDGITYTRTDGGEELVEFGTTIKWDDRGDPFNSVIGNFMKIGGKYFDGLYEYKQEGQYGIPYNFRIENNTLLYDIIPFDVPSFAKSIGVNTKSGTLVIMKRDENGDFIGYYSNNSSGQSIVKYNGRLYYANRYGANCSYTDLSTGETTSLTNGQQVTVGSITTYIMLDTEMEDNDKLVYFIPSGNWEYNVYIDTYTLLQPSGGFRYQSYYFADTQLNATPDYVYETTFYGKNGVENGTLTTSVSNSFTDVNAEVYAKIQAQYNNMQPRILTDQDKDIDKNIRTIPSKTDGTLLLDTSNVTNMNNMFAYCKSLTTIPLLDTSNVTNMYTMFSNCTSLTTIPELDTSNVTNMKYMFSNCTSLTTIPELDTSNVTAMQYMFDRCNNLTTIPLLDTSNVTDMYYMFSNCTSLTTIPELDTKKVINMSSMFYDCSSLNNESLNNILAMCANAAKITSNKTLKYIGLTEEQATICQSLSNYQAFTNAGWTTGY